MPSSSKYSVSEQFTIAIGIRSTTWMWMELGKVAFHNCVFLYNDDSSTFRWIWRQVDFIQKRIQSVLCEWSNLIFPLQFGCRRFLICFIFKLVFQAFAQTQDTPQWLWTSRRRQFYVLVRSMPLPLRYSKTQPFLLLIPLHSRMLV